MNNFTLPENSQTYVNSVKDRCRDLINFKIWTGIKDYELSRWLSNFKNEVEEYFAACVLDALTYRSEDQVLASLNELFTKKIVIELRKLGYNFSDYKDLMNLFQGSCDRDIRLVSVANQGDPPSKSSEILLRLLRRKLNFNENWYLHPSQLAKTIQADSAKTFIFIDDFLGTGDQFLSMYRGLGLQLVLKDCNSIYSPLAACDIGIEAIKEFDSSIIIVSAEKLTSENDIFSFAFDDGVNSPEGAREFYKQLIKNNFPNLSKHNIFGHGNLGLAFAFSHASPDNSLNIIWDSTTNWNPLIRK